ncbi:MAG: DUF1446 domain-containing protein [Planctomycetaceae bacterium]|nr:DUF1446 domain-containing protein [Planctomycetaceae bacterium]
MTDTSLKNTGRSDTIRIANVQAFWGDYSQAAADLLRQEPDIDFLTLDYLAEVSMSILAKQQRRQPDRGYAADFLDVVRSIAPFWNQGSRVKVIANAGGLAPRQCALACQVILREAGCPGRKIGVVTGDDVLCVLQAEPHSELSRNLDTGEQLGDRAQQLITASAYVGAAAIVEALQADCDLIITGRVADPSMVVAPCQYAFGWADDDYDRLAGATIAGHLIECGTHVTGGISTQWMDLEDVCQIGYPIVEVDAGGGCVVTKPKETGGAVNVRTVKEQLLYELGNPDSYLSPDCTVSFLSLSVAQIGPDRVAVRGARGSSPPATLKVSATFPAGFQSSGSLVIFGERAAEKGRRAGAAVLNRLQSQGLAPDESRIECLGGGSTVPLPHLQRDDLTEVVLRVSVADAQRAPVAQFARDWTSLVCSGPQGTTGYAAGRPRVSETFAYWPCLVAADRVSMEIEVLS